MAMTSTAPIEPLERRYGLPDGYGDFAASEPSAVSWGAIAAGAAAGASLSLILLILGVGLGLSSVSPWASAGISASGFGVYTILWLTLTQLLASAMGGYLAGRLRTKWLDTHADEVYFRDTAHGFLAWAVSSLLSAVLLTTVIGSILGNGVQAGAAVLGGVANTATAAAGGFAASDKTASTENGPMAYFVDSLFRHNERTADIPADAASPATASESTLARDAAEVGRIFMNVSRTAPLPPEDLRYVGQIVAQHVGIPQAEAEKRVASVYAQAQSSLHAAEVATKDGADKARKASAYAALWIFVALLGGAFVSSLSATFGGRQRDA